MFLINTLIKMAICTLILRTELKMMLIFGMGISNFMLMLVFCTVTPYELLFVSEKCAAYIFRAELGLLGSG
jgi:hypothetical protein